MCSTSFISKNLCCFVIKFKYSGSTSETSELQLFWGEKIEFFMRWYVTVYSHLRQDGKRRIL